MFDKYRKVNIHGNQFSDRTKKIHWLELSKGLHTQGKYLRNSPVSPLQGLAGEEFKRHFPCALRPLANTNAR
jgi:hypothetical protein